MKVLFDESRCDLQGICIDVCPEVFGLDDEEDRLVLSTDQPDESLRDKVEAAVMRCPAQAIDLVG